MRTIHLLIPGLQWPLDSVHEALRGMRTHALSTLLGRGTTRAAPGATAQDVLLRWYGLDPADAPFSALRLAGEGLDPGDKVWLCADPVHLRVLRDTLVLVDHHELGLEAGECALLMESFNATFSDLGRFHAPQPERWYLELHRPPEVRFAPLADVVGRRVEGFMPAGPQGALWRRTLNEVQMFLYAHPANEAREAGRRPTVNSVWFWGAGRRPEALAPAFDAVLADAPLPRGLARLSGAVDGLVPERFEAGEIPPDTLVVLEDLHYPALYRDVGAWQSALVEMERLWFAPLLAALRKGQLDSLRLTLPGDQVCLDVECRADGLWKFWRRPQSLETFLRRHPAP